MYLVKRTVGLIQFVVALFFLIGHVCAYVRNDIMPGSSFLGACIVAYTALNALCGLFLIFTPAPDA